MKPTYEELEAEVRHLRELLKQALEKIAQLEEQLKRNSKNSSKPPSTDQKSNTPDAESKKARDSRAGKARLSFPPDKIDSHVQCNQENCPHCGSSKIQLSGRSPEILQQAELPEIKAVITEFQLQKYRCNECGKNSTASLPPGIPDSAFGPKLMGLLVTLTGVLHVAKREAIQLIKDLYDVDMGVGSVPNVEERVAVALDPVYDRIHKFVVEHAFCTHFDETGWRDRGKRHFVWLATCQQAAVYRIDRNRSAAAFKRLIGQETWTAPAVTDRYAVYSSFKDHQFCLAHLIREFKGYGEREGPDKSIGLALENELRLSCRVHREYREGKIPLVQRNRRLGARKRRVEYWLEDGLANGSDALAKICGTLLEDFQKLWTFTRILGMEPTNNMAERDLRKLVIWRRRSYGTRSNRGKKFVERVTTVAQTLRKQGRNVLHFIQEAIECFYSQVLPPLISEAMGF
ncbi:MAG: IS66 family transposase [Planctomycetes bacterium]|nr:IS66 family transposase [Planctomycetota bacterium]